MSTQPPLHGLRVLELATGIAGPYAGRLLAMLGATVIKVEHTGADATLSYPVDDAPLPEALAAGGTGPLYLHLNAGKRNISANSAQLAALLDWCQILID